MCVCVCVCVCVWVCGVECVSMLSGMLHCSMAFQVAFKGAIMLNSKLIVDMCTAPSYDIS